MTKFTVWDLIEFVVKHQIHYDAEILLEQDARHIVCSKPDSIYPEWVDVDYAKMFAPVTYKEDKNLYLDINY